MVLVVEQKREEIVEVTLDRPRELNALNMEILVKLKELLEGDRLTGNKILLIRGAGRAFSAGADIHAMAKMGEEELRAFSELGQQVNNLLEEVPLITVALLHGYALGGGLELALSCDFIYGEKSVKVGFPEVRLGLVPGFGGIRRLLRILDPKRALMLLATGKRLDGRRAYELGLITHLVEDGAVEEMIDKELLELLGASHEVLISNKRAVYSKERLTIETADFVRCFNTVAAKKAIEGFTQK